ncbi:MAG: ribonuclease R [Paracoccaceae bacterium]
MADFPSKAQILDWLRENPGRVGKRDIARAFNIKGADRVALKEVLRELKGDGSLDGSRKRLRPAGHLPKVAMLVADRIDRDGELSARPNDWDEDAPPPPILVVRRDGDPALAPGDRFLAKLMPIHDTDLDPPLRYEARLVKKIAASARRMLGIFRAEGAGGRILPVDKKSDREWLIPPGASDGAEDGELVEAEGTGSPRLGLPRGRVVARLGDPGAPRQVSLIALHQFGIPDAFPDEVLAEAAQMAETVPAAPPGAEHREDLREVPLLTIDPADARDHDDAVAARPDPDPDNPGGHILWIAIADVAAFVRPGAALDREARRRGNSTYFPDRVAPMLPETLSADLCSLIPSVDRLCLGLRVVLDAEGRKRSHRFCRGVMASRAALSYTDAQAAIDGYPSAAAVPWLDTALRPLWAAYGALARAREARQPLALDLPERQVVLDAEGRVTGIPIRERFDAHRLIEEFMVLANVCAAETLEGRRPLLYRVHEEPDPERIEALRETVESLGLSLAKGQVLTTRDLNRLLAQAEATEATEMVNLRVLRAQTQAYYAPENFGHFGLNLPRYAHFTSPIRRYADLIVHRALISALGLGPDGQTAEEAAALKDTAQAISATERRSMEAERDTVDRYVADYMADREGAEFAGRITGVQRFGLFVKLDETGADGLVPVGTLGGEYYRHDGEAQTLTGERSGRVYAVGMRARIRLLEASPITGGLIFELLEATGTAPRTAHRSGQAPRRRLDRARIAKAKAARKARRRS